MGDSVDNTANCHKYTRGSRKTKTPKQKREVLKNKNLGLARQRKRIHTKTTCDHSKVGNQTIPPKTSKQIWQNTTKHQFWSKTWEAVPSTSRREDRDLHVPHPLRRVWQPSRFHLSRGDGLLNLLTCSQTGRVRRNCLWIYPPETGFLMCIGWNMSRWLKIAKLQGKPHRIAVRVFREWLL